MAKIDNSNYNKISVKTDSTVKLIETLKDLGVFKEKRKPRRPKQKQEEDIRQEGDIGPGYTKELPTQIRVEPEKQLLTSEDIDTRANALIAQLKDDIAQNRLEDLQRTGQALYSLYSAVQPKIQRTEFKQPYDPFAQQQQQQIYLLPDIEEREFSGTLSEGAPPEESLKQETIFTPEQSSVKLKVRKTGVADKYKRFQEYYELPPFPKAGEFGLAAMQKYYRNFIEKTGYEMDESILDNISSMRGFMSEIIKSTDLI